MNTTSATTTPIEGSGAKSQSDELFGHPKGLYVCFATELWERFSFYGMKYLLLLYLTKYHLFSDSGSLDVLGAYAGLVYSLPLIGGLLADRYLGMRKAVVFGGILLCMGHLLMAYEGSEAARYVVGTTLTEDITLNNGTVLVAGTILQETVVVQDVLALNVFFLALALIAVGIGFLKPNISTIVGELYAKDDKRRDAGFTIFYMGINIGSFTAILLCGWLGEAFGWGYGFGAAGIGMLLGLAVFLKGQPLLNGAADPKQPEILKEKVIGGITKEWAIYLGAILSLGLVWYMLQYEPIVHTTQNILLAAALIGLPAYAYFTGAKEEFHRTVVLMVLIASSVVFWSLFEQSAGSMTLYADRVVDRSFMGGEIKASQFGSLNPLFIILFAPVLAFLWIKLGNKNWEPSIPVKFGIATILAGLGFGSMVIGASMLGESGKVAMIWLTLAYLLHTLGELCISPVGLSAVTKLSIGRVVSVSMGTWFLATALAETVSTRIGKMASIEVPDGETLSVAEMLATYTSLYEFLMWLGIGVGIFLLVITPLLKKGMHGIR